MTYLTYNVTTNSGVVNVKTLEEAVSSGYPFVAVFTAVREPMASFGKGRQAVSRSECGKSSVAHKIKQKKGVH